MRKTIIGLSLLTLLVCSPAFASKPAATPIATIKSTCRGQPASTQSIRLYQDGSVDAKTNGDGAHSTMKVTVDGDIVTMVQTLPYGTITRRTDMAAYGRYMKAHPHAAASDKKSYQNLLAMMKANCTSEAHFQSGATGAAGQ